MSTTAWYILPSQKWWARWFNILHWPYTAWHLSYVAGGAMLAETVNWPVVGWTLLAFFLGMGVAAHSLDLLRGDPLKLGLNTWGLSILGSLALAAAVLIGLLQLVAGNVPPGLLFALPIGAVLVIGYNIEWRGFHGDWQFATWWAVFPLLVGYFAQGIDFHPVLVLASIFAFCSAYGQRVLSTRARYLRRRVGDYCKLSVQEFGSTPERLGDYSWMPVLNKTYDKAWLLEPLDRGLMWFNAMMVALALGMVILRYVQ